MPARPPRSHRIRHLEPCNHQGLTPPCSQALLDAGITRVHYAVPDPTPAAGGANTLRAHGVQVTPGPLTEQAEELLEPWLFAFHTSALRDLQGRQHPDGNVAAADASSRWITGEAARSWAHELAAQVDAIAVGSATYHRRSAVECPGYRGRKPRRIVLGDVAAEGFWVIPATIRRQL